MLDPKEFLAEIKKKEYDLLTPQTGATRPTISIKDTTSLNENILYSQTDKKKSYLQTIMAKIGKDGDPKFKYKHPNPNKRLDGSTSSYGWRNWADSSRSSNNRNSKRTKK